MSSHYDSRNTDVSDATRDAPGADDNASGTAAVLEAARVMAGLPLHATVIFATYDSEEQGLFGSAHHAAALKAAASTFRAISTTTSSARRSVNKGRGTPTSCGSSRRRSRPAPIPRS